MRKKTFVLATAAVAVIAAAGCSTLGRAAFADPVVTLKNVNVVGLGMTGGNLDVVLNVYNPNGYRLDATRLNYRVQIDSTPLANGALDSRFTVQNNDSTQVHIPITFSWSGLGAGARQIFNTGAVNYHVLGDVTVGSPVGSYTIPFSQTGRFSTLGR
jgi:LEA14-like dessication related protein